MTRGIWRFDATKFTNLGPIPNWPIYTIKALIGSARPDYLYPVHFVVFFGNALIPLKLGQKWELEREADFREEKSPMSALEAYASRNPDEIHTDVLLKARQACYKARDAFYACLEKESNKKPTEIASVGLLYPAECKASRAEFVNHCRASWVIKFAFQALIS